MGNRGAANVPESGELNRCTTTSMVADMAATFAMAQAFQKRDFMRKRMFLRQDLFVQSGDCAGVDIVVLKAARRLRWRTGIELINGKMKIIENLNK